MRILIVCNKTLFRSGRNRIDSGYYNVFLPLGQLGHQVEFYDTIRPKDHNFLRTVSRFSPDLIFCCLTGDSGFAPYEPLEEIAEITRLGNIKTFNWFCDDTWRFDSFSSRICKKFHCCSTPEPSYIQKYKSAGYDNIILGSWHCNRDIVVKAERETAPIGFCGGMTSDRSDHLSRLGESFKVWCFSGCCYEDMFFNYSSCKIGVNLSVNGNDPEKKTQMKLRVMEVPNSGSLLISEYTSGIEDLFLPDEEIITFKSPEEMEEKVKFYLSHDSERLRIAGKGEDRFAKDHQSKVRLARIIEQIKKI